MKRLMFAVGMAVLLCGAATAKPTALHGPEKIFTYMFDVFHGREALTQAMLKQTSGESELTKIAQDAFVYFEIETLAVQLSAPLSQALSPSETEQCLAFIESEAGAALLRASQSAGSVSGLPRQIDMLPAQEQAAILAFFDSNCLNKTNAVLLSKEAQQISRLYGKSLMCSYAERNSVEMLDALRGLGECPEP